MTVPRRGRSSHVMRLPAPVLLGAAARSCSRVWWYSFRVARWPTLTYVMPDEARFWNVVGGGG